MPQEIPLKRREAVELVAAQLDAPISFDEFTTRVLALSPSHAKNPKGAVRTELRGHSADLGVVFLDDKRSTLIPLRIGMRGVCFRHLITQREAETGVLLIDTDISTFLPARVSFEQKFWEKTELVDAKGKPLPTKLRSVSEPTKPLLSLRPTISTGFALTDWFLDHQIQAGDSVLFTIEDWTNPSFRLVHEPAAQRREAVIQARNAELMEILYGVLEATQDESLYEREAIIGAYLRLADPRGYPGDPWRQALEEDGRMRATGFDIRYADTRDFFDTLRGEPFEAEAEEETPLSAEEANRIYRFKAAFKHRPSLWRRIEILGGQTLADFNAILVDAFQHESDHLGGFWKRIRRGHTNRYREVDLGSIDPFGEGEGADVLIAELELTPGAELRYVYDFGDWIEHVITVEEVLAPDQAEAQAEYPRVIGQNKPRHQMCRHCQAAGRKTVATWICIDCSNEAQTDVLVCEACLAQYHEDHYADKVVY